MYPNLKLQLWRAGIRQNELARLLHIDDTVLSKIVNGYREPTTELRRRIAEVLEQDECWLFEPTPGVRHSRLGSDAHNES